MVDQNILPLSLSDALNKALEEEGLPAIFNGDRTNYNKALTALAYLAMRANDPWVGAAERQRIKADVAATLGSVKQ